MTMRRLGRSGLEIAPLVFGGNVFGWTIDEATSFRLLDAFVDAGFNCVDTADVYSKWASCNKGGESETIIGNWITSRGSRARIVIATKVGMEMTADRKGLRKAYILRAVEDSLRRLQTDVIDLYQSHTDDADTPLAETLEAHASLVKQGKVRAIGASNYTAGRLAEALAISSRLGLPRYETLQPNYNLYDRSELEGPLEAICLKEGLGVISYFSLASGFLTGKYRSEVDLSKSERGGDVKAYLNPRGFRILAALDRAAARYGATPVQVAIAWLLARPVITAPIASATSPVQLAELVKGARLKLDGETIADLTTASRAEA